MTLTTKLTNRTASLLGGATSRRGFLTRTAMAGSAVTAAGVTYATKPGTAYAAVCNCNGRSCNCSDLCCDGYTEFCCQIYGRNSCPPGSILAGWWKVDNSEFCHGAARYYMDCNQSPAGCCGDDMSSGGGGGGYGGYQATAQTAHTSVCSGGGVRCQCRQCGNRKDGCTAFRYGNCNNQVTCVGPIMCRVVTCAKPWEIDPGCSTVSRTDNNTRHHHRPCVNEPLPAERAFVEALYRDFLRRNSDERGMRFHADRLRSLAGHPVGGRDHVAWGFAFSTEYLRTTVADYYRLGLGRSPDRSGRDYWVGRIQAGAKPSDIAAFIFSSDEFYQLAGGTNAGFVRRLFRRLLDRSPSSVELDHWTGRMAAGTNRTTVALAVFQSLESRRNRVTALYRRFLRRTPDTAGRDYWSEQILRQEDIALSLYICASQEYFQRASRRFG